MIKKCVGQVFVTACRRFQYGTRFTDYITPRILCNNNEAYYDVEWMMGIKMHGMIFDWLES